MTDATPSNLARLSRLMAWLATIGLILWPASDIFVYLHPAWAEGLNFDADHLGTVLNDGVPILYRLAALAFSLGAEFFTVWALWSLRALFLLYAEGEVFSPQALKLLNNIAVALFAGVIVGFVVHAPITLLLTWPLGHGHQAISLNFGSDDVITLFSAGVGLVAARVMVEARRLADENAKFV
ncbi:MAG TPA: DUF2975 domain-containing protein [Rhizomicrobium sp.]|jgi:hypothetical protein|nr:DUF2975 domain-containing protein [Rhizomicrobium sp.]